MAGKKSSKKSTGTDSKKPKKENKNKKESKKDKKSKVSKKNSEKGSHGKLGTNDSMASSKKVIPWSHEPQIQYRLSDAMWVEKGWTVLPMEKIIHKVVTYKIIHSKPHMMLFKRRPKQITKSYNSGVTMAVFKKNGLGSIFYPDGRVAVTRKRGRKCSRLIIFNPSKLKSNSEMLIEPSRGRSEGTMSPRNTSPSNQRVRSKSPERRRVAGICAMFDTWGNGVVYDEAGNIRLNYTQREGILVDTPNGLPVKWKWPVKFTKGDSVENLGTQELMVDVEKVEDEKDSDDEDENKTDVKETEHKEKHGKGKKGSSKGKPLDKKESKGKKSASARQSSEVGKKGSKTKKTKGGKNTAESKSGDKLESKSSIKPKKKRSASGKSSDTTDTPKSKKQKKRNSAGGGEEKGTSEGHNEPETTESKAWPDIPEETCDQLTGKMADGGGDEPETMLSAMNVVGEDVKQQIAEIHALRDKYAMPCVAALKPIVLKINDFLTFRALDQANICLEFHAQTKMLRMELGYVVDPSEKIKVNKVDPEKWFVDKGVPCQIELFAKRSMNRYKTMLGRQRELGAKRVAERRQNEKRFGGPYLK